MFFCSSHAIRGVVLGNFSLVCTIKCCELISVLQFPLFSFANHHHSLCLAQARQRQKGMKATMMKTKAPRTTPTMR